MAFKQCFSWWCFEGKIDLEDVCRGALEIGLQGIELLEPERWDLARKCGLEIVTHRGHDSIIAGLNDPSQHARIERELIENIKLAETWHVPVLVCFAGSLHPRPSDGAQRVAAGLSRVLAAAEDAGVTLALELLNSKVDHAGYQADSTAFGLEVCDLLKSERLKLLYDIYHMQVMEGDVISRIQAHHQSIAHYHTAGVPGRQDLDADQELNYPAIAKAISATGFSGFVGHEFLPKGDPLEALKFAFKTCDVA